MKAMRVFSPNSGAVTQQVGHPHRFNDDGLEFLKDRTFHIGLEVDLVAAQKPAHDFGVGQLLQFPLNCAVPAGHGARTIWRR